ncbi:hypothetical protein RGUI_1887 [Rhodovulum sp. P5]|nr:hypothetical protein RGUI_1887 [Rhodovulum sp. P5]
MSPLALLAPGTRVFSGSIPKCKPCVTKKPQFRHKMWLRT